MEAFKNENQGVRRADEDKKLISVELKELFAYQEEIKLLLKEKDHIKQQKNAMYNSGGKDSKKREREKEHMILENKKIKVRVLSCLSNIYLFSVLIHFL